METNNSNPWPKPQKLKEFNLLDAVDSFTTVLDRTEYRFERSMMVGTWRAETYESGVVVGDLRWFAGRLWCCSYVNENGWFSRPSCSWWPHNP